MRSDKTLPSNAPNIAASARINTLFCLRYPFRAKSIAESELCISTPIRFVALASTGDKPKARYRAMDMAVPPAESVLTNPTISPEISSVRTMTRLIAADDVCCALVYLCFCLQSLVSSFINLRSSMSNLATFCGGSTS